MPLPLASGVESEGLAEGRRHEVLQARVLGSRGCTGRSRVCGARRLAPPAGVGVGRVDVHRSVRRLRRALSAALNERDGPDAGLVPDERAAQDARARAEDEDAAVREADDEPGRVERDGRGDGGGGGRQGNWKRVWSVRKGGVDV